MIDSEVMSRATAEEAYDRTRGGLTVQEYRRAFREEAEAEMRGLSTDDRRMRFYTRYNWDRLRRLEDLVSPSPQLSAALGATGGPQTWLYITETWCADAAYSQPVIEAAAAERGEVDLRFLLRDENLDVMERYLTGSSRSIPMLVVFDESGQEILRWGSKPEALAVYRKRLESEGATGREISRLTIDWYEDQGWKEVERELAQLFSQVAGSTAEGGS